MTKDTLFQYAEAHKAPFIELSDYIYDHPEIGFQEFKACAAITDLLERSGFTHAPGEIRSPGRPAAMRQMRFIPPIEEAGSTDYANVMYLAPGAVIRLAFTQVGDTPHTDGMLKAGKSEDAHQAIVTGAQIITGVCYDLITDPGKLQEVKEDFRQSKEKALSVS